MREALRLAEQAASLDEVPVGAIVLAADGSFLAEAHNRRELDQDPCAHAELLALRLAADRLDSWRLLDTTLYVTLEPCCMCAGALVNARVGRLVFGAYDPKAGAVGSLMNLAQDTRLNHRLEVRGGVCETACGDILRQFFRQRRRLAAQAAKSSQARSSRVED